MNDTEEEEKIQTKQTHTRIRCSEIRATRAFVIQTTETKQQTEIPLAFIFCHYKFFLCVCGRFFFCGRARERIFPFDLHIFICWMRVYFACISRECTCHILIWMLRENGEKKGDSKRSEMPQKRLQPLSVTKSKQRMKIRRQAKRQTAPMGWWSTTHNICIWICSLFGAGSAHVYTLTSHNLFTYPIQFLNIV